MAAWGCHLRSRLVGMVEGRKPRRPGRNIYSKCDSQKIDLVRCKKVKASHTRYRALGLERIPVYRQSARRRMTASGGRLSLLSARPVVTFPAAAAW